MARRFESCLSLPMKKQDIKNLIEKNSVTSPMGQVILTSQDALIEGLIRLIEKDVDDEKRKLLVDVHTRLKGKVERLILSVVSDHGLEP